MTRQEAQRELRARERMLDSCILRRIVATGALASGHRCAT